MLLKKIFGFWWRKKKSSDLEFLSYNLMLNFGKKIRDLRKEKKILTLVLSEKKILNETKNHNPPCKLNGRSLSHKVFAVTLADTFQYQSQFVDTDNITPWEQR